MENKTNTKRLERVQGMALKYMAGAMPSTPYTALNYLAGTVSRPGAGKDANGQILRALLFAPEDCSVGWITQVTDGVTDGVEEDNSLRVVREVLEAEGWGLTITSVWNRYPTNTKP